MCEVAPKQCKTPGDYWVMTNAKIRIEPNEHVPEVRFSRLSNIACGRHLPKLVKHLAALNAEHSTQPATDGVTIKVRRWAEDSKTVYWS